MNPPDYITIDRESILKLLFLSSGGRLLGTKTIESSECVSVSQGNNAIVDCSPIIGNNPTFINNTGSIITKEEFRLKIATIDAPNDNRIVISSSKTDKVLAMMIGGEVGFYSKSDTVSPDYYLWEYQTVDLGSNLQRHLINVLMIKVGSFCYYLSHSGGVLKGTIVLNNFFSEHHNWSIETCDYPVLR